MTNETNKVTINETNTNAITEANCETNELLYKHATGPIPYGLKNDYMFHVVFQENMHALKGLISSVLHIKYLMNITGLTVPWDTCAEATIILTTVMITSKQNLQYISAF